MKKVRSWCPGARRPVREADLRGKHVRCAECGQRFIPRAIRPAPGAEPTGLEVPPHKAY